MTSSTPAVDIGILTIRDDEFSAVLKVFPDEVGIYRGAREYTLRYAGAGGGNRYTVAVLRQIEQGNGEAQDAARDLIDDLRPSLVLVVGIAAGLPSEDVTLGDVIISTRVNDYSVEARKSRSKPTYSLSGGPVEKRIAARIANLAGRRRDLGSWTNGLPEMPRVAWVRRGQLYGPKHWQQELREKLQAHHGPGAKPRQPIFKAGPIASSDRLVKDPAVLFPWIQTARQLLAIEMESGGVYRAARDRCAMLSIRGISDIVGLKRADAWTKFACASAAGFARAFLRTQPVAPLSAKASGTAVSLGFTESDSADQQSFVDTLYANLVPLLHFPSSVHVAPATCSTYEEAWKLLLRDTKEHVPRCWVLHNKTIYSFEDPRASPLKNIVDTSGIELHAVTEFADVIDRDRRRLFVQLLNGALRDDLGLMGVWFAPDDNVHMFAGRPDEPPRTYKYKNVHVNSTMTVVSHYSSRSKDGRTFKYLRHLAFAGRFRLLGREWFLEITPTYRFTTDGKRKDRFHGERLSGIKRLEGNRAVLSQVLLWNHVLSAEPTSQKNGRRLLRFGTVPIFTVNRPLPDEEIAPAAALEELSDTDDARVAHQEAAEL